MRTSLILSSIFCSAALGQTVTVGLAGRSVQDKLHEIVSVEDYGAIGNGTANDSRACQAAEDDLESAGGGILQFGGKTYICNFRIGSNVWLRGAGAGATTLKSAPGSNLDVVQGKHFLALDNTPQIIPETRGDNFTRITGLTIDGNKATNSSGYCVRVWGMAMYWEDVVCQNAASGGIVTEYSDGSGTTYFPADPKRGDTRAHFINIRTYNNHGEGWLYEGPNDGVIDGWIGTLDTSWGIDWEARLLQGTVNISGTSVTWVSGATFTGLVPGAGFQVGGPSGAETPYTISSCRDSTHCTLTASAGTQTGARYLVVFYLGTTDEFSDGNAYGEGSSGAGCFNEGPGAGSLAWTSVMATSCPIGITMAANDGDEKMTNMTVAGNSNYGIRLQGAGNHFQGEVSGNGTGMLVSGIETFIDVHGNGNKTAINNVGASGFIRGVFDVPTGGALATGSAWASNATVQLEGVGAVTSSFTQIPSLFDASTGQNLLTVRNQSSPADYLQLSHTGAGGGHIDTFGTGGLWLDSRSGNDVYIGPGANGSYSLMASGQATNRTPVINTTSFGAWRVISQGNEAGIRQYGDSSPTHAGEGEVYAGGMNEPLVFSTNNTPRGRFSPSTGDFTVGADADLGSKMGVVGLPIYKNNAAALAGGLSIGAFYRTGGDPDLVCVVH